MNSCLLKTRVAWIKWFLKWQSVRGLAVRLNRFDGSACEKRGIVFIILTLLCTCLQQPEDIDARRKKTDEPTPDDEEEEEEEEKEKEEKKKADVGAGGDGAGDKPSQADLETTEVCQNLVHRKSPLETLTAGTLQTSCDSNQHWLSFCFSDLDPFSSIVLHVFLKCFFLCVCVCVWCFVFCMHVESQNCRFCVRVLLLSFVSFFVCTMSEQKMFQYLSLREKLFCIAPVEHLIRGMCSLLPYSTGICHYLLYFFPYCFHPFLFLCFFFLFSQPSTDKLAGMVDSANMP